MIINKFENMISEKYMDLTLIEKKIFQFYTEMKDNNYSEIIISDSIFSSLATLHEYIITFQNLNINKINYAVRTSNLLEELYIFQKLGCKLGKIFLFKNEYNEKDQAIEIYMPQPIL